mmetsp:Transcript_11267/g.22703  ORF Transcript_11267/g.22703 Transcript_11267/m.22703 type:complete len:124 (+) Transcript_11267:6523-6894(+)
MFPLVSQLPSSIFVFWLSSTAWNPIQNALLYSKRGRRLLGLPNVEAIKSEGTSRRGLPTVMSRLDDRVGRAREEMELIRNLLQASSLPKSAMPDQEDVKRINHIISEECRRGHLTVPFHAELR